MLREILETLSEGVLIKGMSLAVFGGFVRVAMQLKGRPIKLYEIFCGVLAASFIGVLIVYIAEYFKLENVLIKIFAMAAGFMHTETITLLKEMFPVLFKKFKKIADLEDGIVAVNKEEEHGRKSE